MARDFRRETRPRQRDHRVPVSGLVLDDLGHPLQRSRLDAFRRADEHRTRGNLVHCRAHYGAKSV